MTLDLHAILGDPLIRSGPPYTFGQLAQAISAAGLPVTAYTWSDRLPKPLQGVKVVEATAPLARLQQLPLRLLRPFATKRNVRQLIRAVRRSSGPRCVWTFGNVPLELMQILHGEGIPVIREKYNCAQRVARDILTSAYRALDLEPQITITDESIRAEEESLRLASGVFCPSPQVAESLRTIGIASDQLLNTSYGWEPARFPDRDRPAPRHEGDGPTVLFLGFVCVRKGAHTLLEAWRRAAPKGRLVLVGHIEPAIAERYAEHLALPSVEHVPFTHEIGEVMRRADWMAFPTLEEGSALITYEALGNGLPIITTPMGAGSLIRDGSEGIVLDDADVDDWADLIRSLPDRGDERDRLSTQARARALEFTWDVVGQRRAAQLLSRFAR